MHSSARQIHAAPNPTPPRSPCCVLRIAFVSLCALAVLCALASSPAAQPNESPDTPPPDGSEPPIQPLDGRPPLPPRASVQDAADAVRQPGELPEGESRAGDGSAQDYRRDARGRRFRVRFDPGTRALVGAAIATDPFDEDALQRRHLELSLGFALRTVFASGQGSSRVSWQIDNRLLDGWVQPLRLDMGGLPAMNVVLYQGDFLRHDASPSLTLPTSPPKRLPFPFDVGMQVEAGRLWIPLASTEPDAPRTLRVTAGKAGFILDPWRSGEIGRSLEFALAVRYDIDIDGDGEQFEDPVMNHRIAPFTLTSVRWRLQDDDGLTAFDARAESAPHWSSEDGWRWSGAAALRFERVLIAINDIPLAFTLDASWRRHPSSLPRRPDAEDELRATLGAAVLFPLR